MKSEKQLTKYGIIYTLAGSFQKGLGFVVFMWLATILTVREYADFGLQYAVFTAIATLAGSGITSAVVALLDEYSSDSARKILFRASGSSFLVLSTISILIFVPILLLFYKQNFNNIADMLIVLISSILSSYYVLQSILVRFNESHFESLILSFVPQFVGYIVGFLFVLYFKSSISFFWGILVGQLLSLSIFCFKQIHFYGFINEVKLVGLLLKRLVPYTFIAVIAWFLGYGNTFFIDYMFEKKFVAIYVFLYTISSILQLVATSMNQVWSPRFFKLFKDISSEEIEKKYLKFSFFQGLVIGGVGLIIIVLVPFMGYFADSLKIYIDSSTELFYLFAGYVVSIPWWHAQNYFFIKNEGKLLLKITAISGLLGFLSWILTMHFFGVYGIYLGFFVNTFLRSLIIFAVANIKWGVKFDYKGIISGMALLLITFLIK